MFIDSHCHLDYFNDKELALIIAHARASRSTIILTNIINFIKDFKKNIRIAKIFKEVKINTGIYPIEISKYSIKEIKNQITEIRNEHLSNKDLIIGIGEVGLDYKDDLKQHEKQKKVFQMFIDLSNELDIPITIHSRKAELDCIEMLERSNAKKVLMHYFSGKLSLADRIINNKWFLSIPTCVVYSEHFQNIIKRAPIEQLLCETDSPYSHPEKKFPNEPANVIESYKMISKIKNLSLIRVEKQIEENFTVLFNYP